ncbi:MAG: cytochrome c oxidase subunit 3 family protein [Myxococcales bacterium]|nr:cytochrome c oxidase subunit 3 family protein [Myxococcales bacterium]MCB9734131.1 cytochrome c oxidase subunit 3 family protein [Deltaproteobacteria bacterium]
MDVEHGHAAHGHDAHGSDHPAFVAHHFDNAGQQEGAAKLGMWVFLATELLMFSGLFLAYFYMRSQYPEMVLEAHHELNKWLGGLNTVFLITSSLTMALAVRAAQVGNRKQSSMMLVATILFACGFMVIKYIEYSAKIEHGLLPGANFFAQHVTTAGGEMIQKAWYGGPQLFFGVYFLMTGLHGVHVLVGIGLLVWILIRTNKGQFSEHYYTPVENVGLYWHLVDLVWIFLFPLLYLVK